MASTVKTMVARAAAILTNAAVAAAQFTATKSADGTLSVRADFTVGSLTNVILNPQVSPDGTTWYDVTTPGALTITATGTKYFSFAIGGAKFARVTATGTGTVTSSSLTLNYHWLDKLGT